MGTRVLALALGLILAGSAHAQFGNEPEVQGKLFTRAEGSIVRAVVRLVITPDKVHLYGEKADPESQGVPLKLAFAGAGVTWRPVIAPPTTTYEHAPVYYGTVVLYALGEVAEGTVPPTDLSVQVTGQFCTEGAGAMCLPLDLALKTGGAGDDAAFAQFPPLTAFGVTAATPTTEPATAPTVAPAGNATGAEDPAAQTDLRGFLLAAIGAGLLALVMPCTYPMIPITISFFTKQAEKRGGHILPLSLTYGVGIVLIFVLIGLAVGEGITAIAQTWQLNLFFGVVFLVFALSLFGCYELNPPSWLLNASVTASSRGGYFGVFMMGATLVVTSFTCTMPFVGSILAVGAKGGTGTVVLGMLAFGLTMAIPFVLLSLVPGRLKAMPKSGQWMNTFKVSLGFVEVAAALKFLSNAEIVNPELQALPRELFLLLWVAIFAAMALFLFGLIDLKGSSAGGVGSWRMTMGLATLMFAVYCGYGAAGYQLDMIMLAIAPPYSGTRAGGPATSASAAKDASGHAIIKEDYDAAVAKATAEKKLVLINFTGVT